MEINYYTGFTQKQVDALEKMDEVWNRHYGIWQAYQWLENRLGKHHKHVVDFRIEMLNKAAEKISAAAVFEELGIMDILRERIKNYKDENELLDENKKGDTGINS